MYIQRMAARSERYRHGSSVSGPLGGEDRTWERGSWRWPRAGMRWPCLPAWAGGEVAGREARPLVLMDVVTGHWEAGVGSLSRL